MYGIYYVVNPPFKARFSHLLDRHLLALRVRFGGVFFTAISVDNSTGQETNNIDNQSLSSGAMDSSSLWRMFKRRETGGENSALTG